MPTTGKLSEYIASLSSTVVLDPATDLLLVYRQSNQSLVSEPLADCVTFTRRKIEQSDIGGFPGYTFANIPGTFGKIVLEFFGRSAKTGQTSDAIAYRFNGDSGNNYDGIDVTNYPSPSSSAFNAFSSLAIHTIAAADAPNSTLGMGKLEIPFYTNTSFYKGFFSNSAYFQDLSQPWGKVMRQGWGWYRSTSPITSVSFYLASGANFSPGSVMVLYGES